MDQQSYLQLSSGFQCPMVGFGTCKTVDNADIATSVRCAVEVGYRHIDTAYTYLNEAGLGSVLNELFQENVVKREEMFVTTKLFGTHQRRELVPRLLRKQLGSLKLSYLDLYLIHSPLSLKYSEAPGFPKDENGNLILDLEATIEDIWLGMEDCVKAGLVRSIGVSNFNQDQLERVLRCGSIRPAMHQVESQPYFHNTKLIDFCHANNVAVTCYGPLGNPGSGKVKNLLQDERLVQIAAKHKKSTAQVALRWQIQRGNAVIPKSATPSRIKENFDVWNFTLSGEDMAIITGMDTNRRAFKMDFPGAKQHPEFPFTELL